MKLFLLRAWISFTLVSNYAVKPWLIRKHDHFKDDIFAWRLSKIRDIDNIRKIELLENPNMIATIHSKMQKSFAVKNSQKHL